MDTPLLKTKPSFLQHRSNMKFFGPVKRIEIENIAKLYGCGI